MMLGRWVALQDPGRQDFSIHKIAVSVSCWMEFSFGILSAATSRHNLVWARQSIEIFYLFQQSRSVSVLGIAAYLSTCRNRSELRLHSISHYLYLVYHNVTTICDCFETTLVSNNHQNSIKINAPLTYIIQAAMGQCSTLPSEGRHSRRRDDESSHRESRTRKTSSQVAPLSEMSHVEQQQVRSPREGMMDGPVPMDTREDTHTATYRHHMPWVLQCRRNVPKHGATCS